ncbi:MAG: ABC transporter ATP-binding protein [Planctomycetota bacterium]
MLELEGVESGYGRIQALHGISFTVKRGEVVTLIGANGAGKSTTLNTICGIVRATKGRILLEGEDIAATPPAAIAAKGIAQVPEGRRLFSDMTVRENLEMGAYLRSDKDAITRDMEHCFELFPRLKERIDQLAGSLSGGEQQMCAIARGIMAQPRILLLDEPSLGLAPILVDQIFDIITQLHQEGKTILLVEQNAMKALRVADRGYVLETGRIKLADDAAALLANDEVKKAYLGM